MSQLPDCRKVTAVTTESTFLCQQVTSKCTCFFRCVGTFQHKRWGVHCLCVRIFAWVVMADPQLFRRTSMKLHEVSCIAFKFQCTFSLDCVRISTWPIRRFCDRRNHGVAHHARDTDAAPGAGARAHAGELPHRRQDRARLQGDPRPAGHGGQLPRAKGGKSLGFLVNGTRLWLQP